MKSPSTPRRRGFTLLETVIAIGVLAVLLSGFMVVFTPAAEGIRKSINVEQAGRMTSALEQELVTLRGDIETSDYKTGFNKAYEWIQDSTKVGEALLVYQYRGALGGNPRADGTPEPVPSVTNKLPGKDYVVVPMVRRKSDNANLPADLAAIEGSVFVVKCTQLLFETGADGKVELKPGTPGKITDPTGQDPSTSGDDYPDAVIAFSAEFHLMPARTAEYFSSPAFTTKFSRLQTPVFTRNLAVRR
jgi:prepilin-type N-terminal cleavage/methylation domain-containing protein